MRKRSALISRPNWPKHFEGYQLIDDIKSILNELEYANIDIVDVPAGTRGAHYFHKHKGKCPMYDLYIAHHPQNNSPNIIDFMQAYYSTVWYFDAGGYAAFNDFADKDIIDREVSDEVCKEFYDQSIVPLKTTTKYQQQNQVALESNIPEQFLFIATQVENDSVMRLKTKSTTDIIKGAAGVAKKMDLPLVIKQHPMTRKGRAIRDAIYLVRSHGVKVYESSADIRQLIERAVAIFVVNSGVGFESLVNLKPVFTYGKADYNQCANFNITDLDQIIDKINNPKPKEEYYRFFYSFWQQNILDMNHPEYKKKMKRIILNK